MSFRLKTILGIAFIECIVLIVLVVTSLNLFNKTLEDEIRKRASTTSNLFAASIKDAVIAGDLATIESVASALLTNPDITYVRVLDDTGDVLEQQGETYQLESSFHQDHNLEDASYDLIYDIRSPIIESGDVYGTVELGLNIGQLDIFISEFRNSITAIAIFEILIVALVSFLFGSYLTRQLVALKQGVEKINAGNLGYTVNIHSTDEIGQLAKSFNAMSKHINNLHYEQKKILQHTQGIVDNILEGIITIDINGIIYDTNPEVENIFGYSKPELVGKNVSLLIPTGKHRTNHDQYLKNASNLDSSIIGLKREIIANKKNGNNIVSPSLRMDIG